MLIVIAGILIGIMTMLVLYIFYLKKKMSFQIKKGIEEKEEEVRKDALKRSRSAIKGNVSEQLAPHMEGVDFNASDARFIGSPIDYIIFDGYTDPENEDIKIIISDVKKGDSAKLTPTQKKIKKAVKEKRVEWKTIRIR